MNYALFDSVGSGVLTFGYDFLCSAVTEAALDKNQPWEP